MLSYKDSLKRHIKTRHEGIKYSCSHCSKSYTSKVNLNEHVRSKHGDPLQRKKYKCPHCD
ncbi:unnamed protein product, partial [Brassicogethes aeneus]